ncbi:MAG: SRPBCC family protein [Nitrospirae bacterium]|nr:SRPBCC family protein [Nitrospirota bacterium]
MATVSKKIVIKAPVDKVFTFVVNPENWTRYVTSLTDIKELSSPAPSVDTTFRWEYRMMGMKFHGKGRITENIKNKRFGLKMEGSFPITETYTFAKVDSGTELSIEVEYEVPGRIMSVVANKGLVEKMNKKESEAVLSKIKMFCEEA